MRLIIDGLDYFQVIYFLRFEFMEYKIVITQQMVDEYCEEYFKQHPRARKAPITRPAHPSINEYSTIDRRAYNSMKQKWKSFIVWVVDKLGYSNLQIEQCNIHYKTYFKTARVRDLDNLSPKFIFDGFIEAGLIVDDNCHHIKQLVIECDFDKENPRMEFTIEVLE